MLDSFTSAVISALCQDGIPAYHEFPQVLRPLPQCGFFVTAAVSEIRLDPPVPTATGGSMPADITLRVRYLFRTDADIPMHTAAADDAILRKLRALHCDLRGLRRSELRYQKQLGRLESETLFSLRGMISYTEGGSA